MSRLLGALVLAAALGCAAVAPRSAPPEPAGAARVVYLVSHGWHVGLAVPHADVSRDLWPESAHFGSTRFLEIGWGDGAYYPAERGTPGLALKAAFRSDSAVLHVAAVDAPLREFFAGSEIIAIGVSVKGFDALTRFVSAGYARDAAGRAMPQGPGLYGRSRFYEATGRYRLFDNSNTWTAKALRAAGCGIEPGEFMTAGGLLRWAREVRAPCP